jgi:hypothetical protein
MRLLRSGYFQRLQKARRLELRPEAGQLERRSFPITINDGGLSIVASALGDEIDLRSTRPLSTAQARVARREGLTVRSTVPMRQVSQLDYLKKLHAALDRKRDATQVARERSRKAEAQRRPESIGGALEVGRYRINDWTETV